VPTIDMKTELPGPRSRAIIERKERVVCDPLDLHVNTVIDHGLGASVTDVDGNTMLDLSSGLGCLLVGHSHPKVVEAVRRQAAKFSHTDFSVVPYEVYVELCERLVERVGQGRKVALFNSGAEAVENAVKFAKAATGRQAVVCFEGAFHGRTLLTMSLTSRHTPYKRGFGPFAAEVYRVPFSYPYRSEDPDGRLALEAFERAFVTTVDPRSVAAVIFEPELGEGGYIVPGGAFLSDVFNSERVIATLASREEKHLLGERVVIRRRYDPKTRRVEKEIEMGGEGCRKTFREAVRAYREDELVELHARAGFRVKASWGDFDGAPFDVARSPRLILLAEREERA